MASENIFAATWFFDLFHTNLFACIVLELPHQVHSSSAQWVYIIQYEGGNNCESVWFMRGYAGLVFIARALATFCQRLHDLVDEAHVVFIDVEPQQAQSPGGATANTIQKNQCLWY